MHVKIKIEFEVDTDDETIARSAASMAAWDFLTLSETGESCVDEVTVYVDGHGDRTVKMGQDHD